MPPAGTGDPAAAFVAVAARRVPARDVDVVDRVRRTNRPLASRGCARFFDRVVVGMFGNLPAATVPDPESHGLVRSAPSR
ncbi:MAG TPA: hypothetical protein VFK54_03820 [Candidatus Limnocylindrales bacterium]|nr:hypothetical protein [Candidatus Limnocylindrales bacterium]